MNVSHKNPNLQERWLLDCSMIDAVECNSFSRITSQKRALEVGLHASKVVPMYGMSLSNKKRFVQCQSIDNIADIHVPEREIREWKRRTLC
mmetsp:Transcript_1022/g.2381  ORF Transcript_1022/g.2381 Transcript_1022/m.2381 type:complete len:91 (-) Transcript_1022:153-425(-)